MKDLEFKDKKVLIFGLGLNDGGVGMAEFFAQQGAHVTITDGKTKQDLADSIKKLEKYNITYHLGGQIEEDFKTVDLVIRNPAIKRDNQWLQVAREAGVPIEMEMSLFHKLSPTPIIGITGTKGKSTTTSLIYEFLKAEKKDKVLLAGNIGKSAIRELPTLTEEILAVLEISSFQLDAMGESKVSPHVSVVTNIYPDHLNWHPDMNDYVESKKNIVRYQNENDVAIINLDNDYTKEFIHATKAKVITYSLKDKDANYFTDEEGNLYENSTLLLNISNAELKGAHNMYNITAAIATVRQYKISAETILLVLSTFKGVKGRQELIRELNGIKFYNDTTATGLEALMVALQRFGPEYEKKIVLIAGGVDKGIDYSEAKELIEKYVKTVVLLEGTASEKIAEVLQDADVEIKKYFGDFKEAIEVAYKSANSGDIVLLSPAAASFNMFKNEFDRGGQFDTYVQELK